MKKLIILLLVVYASLNAVQFNGFTNFSGTVASDDEFIFWDTSANGGSGEVVNLTGTNLRDYIFGSGFTLSGTLTGGGQTISGTAFDINGGNIDGTAIGAASTSTGAFTTITASGAVTLSGALTVGAGDFTYAGTAITSTGAELNKLDAMTATTDELKLLDQDEDDAIFDDSNLLKFRMNTQTTYAMSSSAFYPLGSGTDVGTVGNQFDKAYFDGMIYIDGVECDGVATFDAGNIIMNDNEGNYSLTYKGASDTELLFIDGTNDYIGVSTNSPSATFHAEAGTVLLNSSCTIAEFNLAATTGGDAYMASMTPTLPDYKNGMLVMLTVDTDNTGACTLNIDGNGARSIKLWNGDDPEDGDVEDTNASILFYDGTNFVIINPTMKGWTDHNTP